MWPSLNFFQFQIIPEFQRIRRQKTGLSKALTRTNWTITRKTNKRTSVILIIVDGTWRDDSFRQYLNLSTRGSRSSTWSWSNWNLSDWGLALLQLSCHLGIVSIATWRAGSRDKLTIVGWELGGSRRGLKAAVLGFEGRHDGGLRGGHVHLRDRFVRDHSDRNGSFARGSKSFESLRLSRRKTAGVEVLGEQFGSIRRRPRRVSGRGRLEVGGRGGGVEREHPGGETVGEWHAVEGNTRVSTRKLVGEGELLLCGSSTRIKNTLSCLNFYFAWNETFRNIWNRKRIRQLVNT